MKILHVIRDLSNATAGPVYALRGLAEAQIRQGHDVIVQTTDRGDCKVIPEGAEVHLTRGLGMWGWSREIGASLDRLIPGVDIVHLHMVWDYPIWAAGKSAERHGKPFVLRPCGLLDSWSLAQKGFKKRIYMRLFGSHIRHASAFHFTSEGERLGAGGVVGNAKSIVIPNCIAESMYTNLPAKTAFTQRFPELSGRRIILFLGRLHPKKQPHLLIDAFAAVKAANSDLHLVLAGPGEDDYVKRLKSRVKKLGLDDCVTFTGALQGDAVREAYSAAEIFALPSLQENFGNAMVEAMAASCPVVISRSLDLAPDIANAEAGLLCEPTVEAFAAALQRLLRDGDLRKLLGANGNRMVVDKFTWAPAAAAMTAAYAALLAAKP